MTSIKTLTARLIVDADIVIKAELLELTEKTAVIFFEGQTKRCKIYTKYDGSKFIYPSGRYSMAPIFNL